MTRLCLRSHKRSLRFVPVFTDGPVMVPLSPRAHNNFLGRDAKYGYLLWRTPDDPGALDRIFWTHGQFSVAFISHFCSNGCPAIGCRYYFSCTVPQRFPHSPSKSSLSPTQVSPDIMGSNHACVSIWSSCIMSHHVFLHCFLTGVAPQPRHTKGAL
jgi:hypothetical protein